MINPASLASLSAMALRANVPSAQAACSYFRSYGLALWSPSSSLSSRTEPGTRSQAFGWCIWEYRYDSPVLVVGALLPSVHRMPAVSRGSTVNRDDPWNPQHIDDLPIEVREYIVRICHGPASAQHDFATYSPHEKRWRINLEYLRCNGLGKYRRGNQCLDVDFIEVGSRFRLAGKQYRDCGF